MVPAEYHRLQSTFDKKNQIHLSSIYLFVLSKGGSILSPRCYRQVCWTHYAMPQFRWPEVAQDISLAKEVASRRPSKPSEWDTIADLLSTAFSTTRKTIHLKGRGCRERMDRLLDKFHTDEAQALKRYNHH